MDTLVLILYSKRYLGKFFSNGYKKNSILKNQMLCIYLKF